MGVVEPFARSGGGSVNFRESGSELIRVGVEGLLPILAQDAVAGRAEPSSSLSSATDLSPGTGQSTSDDATGEWVDATVAGFVLGVSEELDDWVGSAGRPRAEGLCMYGSYGTMLSCRLCFPLQ